jgi:3'-phosphoadenosine 5'-phosphosulfate sulfotransferase (PAPS reductase)/FAD synthetase
MSDHYKLQSTPASIAFSGGRTSGYMLYKILEAHNGKLPVDTIVNFENTGEEVEATYEFIQEVEKQWHVKITWLEYNDKFRLTDYLNKGKLSTHRKLRNFNNKNDLGFKKVNFKTASRKGEPYDKMLNYYWIYRKALKDGGHMLPTRVTRMCTSHLKIKTIDRYMQSLGYKSWDSYIGIRYDEPRRWSKMSDINNRKERQQVIYPMVSAKVCREDVLEFWSKQKFDLQLDPNAEEGNCRLCFLKKTSTMIKLIKKLIQEGNQQEVNRWLKREELGDMTFRIDRPKISDLVQIALSQNEIKIEPKEEEEIDCFCGSPAV